MTTSTTAATVRPPAHGDIDSQEFRRAMHRVADMIADYLESVDEYPVTPRIRPGDVRRQLPPQPPEEAVGLDTILDDYRQVLEPNVTHWNHPGFMAYFAVTGSGPGILGEALSAGLNVNAMLWRTGPAPTELEEHVCDWLRQWMGLPEQYRGHINDTASIGSLLALGAARNGLRDLDIRNLGMAGRDIPRLTVYCSEQAHSSIDKAVLTLGLGLENLRKIPTDKAFRMDPAALRAQVERDVAGGCRPMAIVATVGTTSTTSIDPVPEIADIAEHFGCWLHVDGAYAGTAAICPEMRAMMPGLDRADSIVTNPHKWMFVPVDCSVLFVRDPQALKQAYSIIPSYLTTTDNAVTNLMDYGVQLGRRFRALKMWMVFRAFGAAGLRERMREHCRLAREFASWVEAEPGFELVAPVPFSTICFRVVDPRRTPQQQDAYNEALLARVNAAGPVLVSHTTLRDRYTMRLCVGNLRTSIETLRTAWRLIREAHAQMGMGQDSLQRQ